MDGRDPSDSDDALAPDACVVGEVVSGGTSKGKTRRGKGTPSERRQSALREPGPAAANMNDWPEFYYGKLGEHEASFNDKFMHGVNLYTDYSGGGTAQQCVRSPPLQVMDKFGYSISFRMICPTELGIPARRKRRWSVSWDPAQVKMKFALEDPMFDQLFGRAVTERGDVFFTVPMA